MRHPMGADCILIGFQDLIFYLDTPFFRVKSTKFYFIRSGYCNQIEKICRRILVTLVVSKTADTKRCSKITFRIVFPINMWYNVLMLDNIYKYDNSELTYGRGYVYSLRYHIVWCTKYRVKVLVGQIEEDAKQHILQTAENLQVSVEAMEFMPDHIHLLVSCKPQFCPADGIKVLKGNTARWLFLAHPELKSRLWGGHLWNPSYFIATVSDRSREQIEEYIRNQKTAPGKPGNPNFRKKA